MPKVSNVRVTIDSEYLVIDIHYNKKESFHLKEFHQKVMGILQMPLSRFGYIQTERELVNLIHSSINDYHKATTTTRKVLSYRLYASHEIAMNRSGVNRGSWQGRRPGISENVQSTREGGDYNIGFDFDVLIETNRNGSQYNIINPDGSIGYTTNLQSDAMIIDWTEQREAAFKMLSEGMYKLMVRICEALGDEQKAIAFIDSKIKLLS